MCSSDLTDPRALREVLTNLIDNAVKFTARGGVGVHAERSRDLLEIRVIDTGVGIPQDALTSIFDPFVRLRTAETSGQVGSGLGLTITRRLVQLLRGTIAVSSNVGGGTTFTVRLPLGDRGPARP